MIEFRIYIEITYCNISILIFIVCKTNPPQKLDKIVQYEFKSKLDCISGTT